MNVNLNTSISVCKIILLIVTILIPIFVFASWHYEKKLAEIKSHPQIEGNTNSCAVNKKIILCKIILLISSLLAPIILYASWILEQKLAETKSQAQGKLMEERNTAIMKEFAALKLKLKPFEEIASQRYPQKTKDEAIMELAKDLTASDFHKILEIFKIPILGCALGCPQTFSTQYAASFLKNGTNYLRIDWKNSPTQEEKSTAFLVSKRLFPNIEGDFIDFNLNLPPPAPIDVKNIFQLEDNTTLTNYHKTLELLKLPINGCAISCKSTFETQYASSFIKHGALYARIDWTRIPTSDEKQIALIVTKRFFENTEAPFIDYNFHSIPPQPSTPLQKDEQLIITPLEYHQALILLQIPIVGCAIQCNQIEETQYSASFIKHQQYYARIDWRRIPTEEERKLALLLSQKMIPNIEGHLIDINYTKFPQH